jgi:Transposase DDE domain
VIDHSARRDGTFERADFTFDQEQDHYICPGDKILKPRHRNFATPRSNVDADGFIRYRATKLDCDACALKPKCCPVAPVRKIMRSIHEGARDVARAIATTDAYLVSHRQRKKVEMLFAHLKRILKLDRLRLRGPYGANSPNCSRYRSQQQPEKVAAVARPKLSSKHDRRQNQLFQQNCSQAGR